MSKPLFSAHGATLLRMATTLAGFVYSWGYSKNINVPFLCFLIIIAIFHIIVLFYTFRAANISLLNSIADSPAFSSLSRDVGSLFLVKIRSNFAALPRILRILAMASGVFLSVSVMVLDYIGTIGNSMKLVWSLIVWSVVEQILEWVFGSSYKNTVTTIGVFLMSFGVPLLFILKIASGDVHWSFFSVCILLMLIPHFSLRVKSNQTHSE